MKILYIRHGESEYNARGLMIGHHDPALTDSGRHQSASIAKSLQGMDFDVILSSDLKRAAESAEIISTVLRIAPNADNGLRELDLGEFAGLTWDEAKTKFRTAFERGHETFWEMFSSNRIPGQESYKGLLERTQKCFHILEQKYSEKSLLVVGHKGFLEAFIAAQLGYRLSRSAIRLDNYGSTLMQWESGTATFFWINACID